MVRTGSDYTTNDDIFTMISKCSRFLSDIGFRKQSSETPGTIERDTVCDNNASFLAWARMSVRYISITTEKERENRTCYEMFFVMYLVNVIDQYSSQTRAF